jgi:hypothetical protein
MEDDDLADAQAGQDARAVDEDALPDAQRRQHRPARDPIGLDEQGLGEKGETHGNDHDR